MVMNFDIPKWTPTSKDVLEAHERIRDGIVRTPVLTSERIDRMCKAEIHFKCENLQRGGAFKYRGALNAVLSLDEERVKMGVATHSSGNHAIALSLAARKRGVPAYIVMPENSPGIKVDGVHGLGGMIEFCAPTQKAREEGALKLLERTGANFVHPYNDPRIISGQGTAALELLRDVGDLDMIVAPVGGGGLLSGTSISVRAFSPDTQIYGAEPSGADDARRSLRAGHIVPSEGPDTICEGLLTSLGDLTFSVIRENVRDILTCPDGVTVRAMKAIADLLKVIVEPSGAVSLGAIMNSPDIFKGKKVGVILSGGNVDISKACSLFQGDHDPSIGGGPGK